MKTEVTVMPAWMAGIQIPKDASGDIPVALDSSSPCGNDGIEGVVLELPALRGEWYCVNQGKSHV
jgi:hypothetical protein